MANIKALIASLLRPTLVREPTRSEASFDRIYHDTIGLSDSDAMWYYERRKWRGRD
jgi:hypothetical protein